MDEVVYPIVTEDGEYLAGDDEERRALVEDLAARLIEAERAAAARPELRRLLALLMDREQPYAADGWAVVREAARRPPGQVLKDQVAAHAEALAPLGLAPREEVAVNETYPGVAAFTSARAKQALARAGLSVETFVWRPEAGEDRITVIPPEGA